MRYFLIGLLCLAGCGSNPPAPVVERNAPTGAAAEPTSSLAAPAVELKSGFYTVKKGDTLYSIALEHGQTYRDVALWNGLDDPNRIQVGQQLRVIPAEAEAPVAVARPVATSAPVEVTANGAADSRADVKREPKGGKLAYSPEALTKMQRSAEPQIVPPKPADKPVEKAGDVTPALTSAAGDSIDWVWPTSGKVMAPFVDGTNKGVDIGAKIGDPVVAAGAGKVIYVGNGIRGYGKMIIIKHNSAFMSVYAHNSQILAKEEQMVGKGQKIAEAGNTDTDQAKLHFEIRYMNKPVDPLKYLPAKP